MSEGRVELITVGVHSGEGTATTPGVAQTIAADGHSVFTTTAGSIHSTETALAQGLSGEDSRRKWEFSTRSAVLQIECNFRLTIDNTAGPGKLTSLSPDSGKGWVCPMAHDSAARDSWWSSILVYRKMSNGSLVWIGTATNKRAAYELIKLHAKEPSDEFSIRRLASRDLTHVRADENH
jgi:hypothetical protein